MKQFIIMASLLALGIFIGMLINGFRAPIEVKMDEAVDWIDTLDMNPAKGGGYHLVIDGPRVA